MTNTIKLYNNESHDACSNTMKTLRELIGYDYYTSRVAFDANGTEVVFVNEGLIGRIRIYIDGEVVVSRYPFTSDYASDSTFEHAGKEYRLISRTTNWISGAQEVTLLINGTQIGKKVDPRLAALSWKQQLHFVGAMTAIGLAFGFLVKLL